MVRKGLVQLWKKYQYALLVVFAGVLLMLLPHTAKHTEKETPSSQGEESFILEDVEQRMERVLGQMQGVGKVRIMLTLKSASEIQVAEDSELRREDDGSYDARHQPLTVNRGSGYQDVVVTGQTYPVFQGAVVVCEGADNSAVQLAVTQAVASLTGLGMDRISVVKWQS